MLRMKREILQSLPANASQAPSKDELASWLNELLEADCESEVFEVSTNRLTSRTAGWQEFVQIRMTHCGVYGMHAGTYLACVVN